MPLMFRQAAAVAARILVEHWRQGRGLIFWAIFPALMMLLFGLIYSGNAAMRVNFDATAAGVLIGAALFFSCLGGTVVVVVAERERGTLRRLLMSPLSPVAYFMGIVMALSVVALGQCAIVFTIAAGLGARYHGSLALGALIVALSVFSYVGLGFFFGARFARRVEDVNGPLAGLGVPLLVLAGTFFPLHLMPEALVRLAWFDPILHMNEAMKGVAGQGLGMAELWPQLVFLMLFCAGSLALGVASYRWLLREAQHGAAS